MKGLKKLSWTILLSGAITCAQAQAQTKSLINDSVTLSWKDHIAVVARPSKDSIALRWAPNDLQTWLKGNANGYTIERYVLVRNGTPLNVPEKAMLQTVPVKPLPEAQWEKLVKNNKYGAIAAQALFGGRFEIDLGKSSVMDIVNKVEENEQRFSFALFCADISPTVAQASGLYYVDRTVKKGEKYFYRIIVHSADSLRGGVFAGTDDLYQLFPPPEASATVRDHQVMLQWERAGSYTAYTVERSVDKKIFTPMSNEPVVTTSETKDGSTRFEYATDSLHNLNQPYYYRVKGITPFGETGMPSEIVTVIGSEPLKAVPYIVKGDNIQNTSVSITWQFSQNDGVKGFHVERSSTGKYDYTNVTRGLLPPDVRTFNDTTADRVNYYRIAAYAYNGEVKRSPVFFVQLIDSIPPGPPKGLKASIDDYGTITLSWDPNSERDVYGYRVYRGNLKSEELFQVTSEPVTTSRYPDKVDLNTLNKTLYYQVMAVDKDQNQSLLSSILELKLPDKVPPVSPVFLPVRSEKDAIVLRWQPSSSDDVVKYDVYRMNAGTKQWIRLKMIPATNDTLYEYRDIDATQNATNSYTIIAIDRGGLESQPASPIRAARIDNSLRPPVEWKEPLINNEKHEALLSWAYEYPNVKHYKIFKSQDGQPPIVRSTVPGDKLKFSDTIIPGTRYRYTIIAVFDDGRMSELSKEIKLNY